ncbi:MULTISPECIES: DUF7946 domain-containing protein [Sphingomonas]|uniref:DUF7946 domain-containing protein n=1 Tax=Sphingomonas TaxID=13687 RepID=UPI000B26ADBA|nr:hypothetical protein [Sphingomonas sp. CCH10-B3]
MEIRFNGGEAGDHRVDLYSGAESLSGLGRVGNLVGHYVAEGNVRFRSPYSSQIQYYLSGTKEGSLTVLISEVIRIAGEAQRAAAKIRASALFRRVLLRATGQAAEGSLNVQGVEYTSGDIDALAEAATPGLLRAHRWIDQPNKSIRIAPEDGEDVTFDSNTREYLETEDISEDEEVLDVSVGALNVNARTGRVFFHGLGRTIPFYVPRASAARTIPTLSRFLTQYAERTGATVNIRYSEVRYSDERLKRIIIHDAYPIAGLQ